jgi:hypothetical protein
MGKQANRKLIHHGSGTSQWNARRRQPVRQLHLCCACPPAGYRGSLPQAGADTVAKWALYGQRRTGLLSPARDGKTIIQHYETGDGEVNDQSGHVH